ncbi:hypothetical protein OOT08_10890, partial [Leucobacter sp. M11]|nr:hypothetical protein [Leucobacter sp. M11]
MPLLDRRLRATIIAAAAVTALVGTGVLPAQAAPEPAELTDLRLDIALNAEYQSADSRGGICNFFSAGAGGEFRQAEGDVSIVKLDADGAAQRPSRASICLPMEGTSINQRARFAHGAGTLDPDTGAGQVRWSGAFTANAYGGLVPWTVTDPVLTVAADGSGELRAIAGGHGANMDNPEGGFPLESREVTLATFPAISIDGGTIEIAPDFAGLDYFPLLEAGNPAAGRSAESAIPAELKDRGPWGSWPESLVDFHYESGLASYWHTSGGSADSNKAPLPLRLVAGGAEVANGPIVTENPKASLEFPVLEGNDLTVTAAVTGASLVSWERQDTRGGPWRTIDGATEATLTIPAIDAGWNGVTVRMVAENAAGQVRSGELRLQTETPRELRVDTQPRSVLAIEGMRPVLDLTVTGTPSPSEFVVERSRDGGATWATLEGVSAERSGAGHRLTLPVADAAGESTVRVHASNRLGQRIQTEPVGYRIVAATGEPQIALAQAEPLDPAAGGLITVVGANFEVPKNDRDGYFGLDVALVADATWQPGQQASQRWEATSADTEWGQLNEGALTASGGGFTVSIPVAARALDPERSYGVATFLRHTNLWWQSTYSDRRADSFTRVALTAPGTAPAEIDPTELTGAARGEVTATLSDTGELAVTVPGQRPDSNVFLSVRSDAQALGWFRLDAASAATVPLPAGIDSGEHRVVVQDVTGELAGWASFTVPEPTT